MVQVVMSQPSIQEPRQKPSMQKIGWITATCVLISNIIGGGIFTTTGFMARDLGDPLLILLLWFIGASLPSVAPWSMGARGPALPSCGRGLRLPARGLWATGGLPQWMDLLHDRLWGRSRCLSDQFFVLCIESDSDRG